MRLKKNILFFLLFFSVSPLFAGHVIPERAKKVAKNLYLERIGIEENTTIKSVSDITIKSIVADNFSSSEVNYYIANIENGGFVIIAGDDAVTPILGYSFENNFDTNNLPPQLKSLLEEYKKEMKDLFDSPSISTSPTVESEWIKYENSSIQNPTSIDAVTPLLSSNWAQGCDYNMYCPYDSDGPCDNALVGCVAIAMGQVMYYHKHPSEGTGSHSYTHSKYGNLSANFASTTYQWSSMQNNSSTSASATLLYHCGVSVDMNYGPSSSGIPVNDLYKVEDAFQNYFNYNKECDILYRSDYSSSTWNNMVKTEIDNKRPLFYVGIGTGGHAFNIDGYQGTNHFHLNWGWGGSYNGYFYLNDLTPGSYNFTDSQAGAFYVQPHGNGCSENFTISSNITSGTHEFLASNSISSSKTISGSANVHFGANKQIRLTNGFKVAKGCKFRADLKGCSRLKTTEKETFASTGKTKIEEPEKALSVYPNPANEHLTIDMKGIVGKKRITILFLDGSIISEITSESNYLDFDLSQYAKGIYFVKVLFGEKLYTERLIIK